MKRFLYKDALNRTTEANNFEPSDFISSYSSTPGLPVKTNSSGFVDPSFIQAVSAAASLSVARVASVNITKGDCVYSTSATHVGVATNNSTQDRALVLGIALNDALAGESVQVILMGAIVDSIFSVFPVNRPLYLDDDGGITDTKPASGFLTPVGKSLGSNTIFVSVGYPSQLGA